VPHTARALRWLRSFVKAIAGANALLLSLAVHGVAASTFDDRESRLAPVTRPVAEESNPKRIAVPTLTTVLSHAFSIAPQESGASASITHSASIPYSILAGDSSDSMVRQPRTIDLPRQRFWPHSYWENLELDAAIDWTSDLASGMAPPDPAKAQREITRGVNWNRLLKQSLLFLGIQHGFRILTESSTRADLRGPFWSDYFKSVKGLRGWRDGDEFITNYIGHPMQGAVSGFIFVQNDRAGIHQRVGFNKPYLMSRLKALGWTTIVSTQFELGLVSEASIGNVGLKPSEHSNHPMGYVDLVVTPIIGTAWLVGEDLIDQYITKRIEGRIKNKWWRAVVRSLTNPTRAFANIHRGKGMWRRDDRPLRAIP
jgi:hypothetical protein